MSKLKSNYVIKLTKAYKTHSRVYIITELCNGGDLELLKRSKGRLKETEARIIIKQIVEALRVLYKNNIVHRDIKLANVLLHFPERR